MSDSRLRVVKLRVRDVLGAREFGVEPGQVTVLEGPNASGKSSVLQAVQSALGGGSLARLARLPADGEVAEDVDPEVVLVLEGGPDRYHVERGPDGVRVRQEASTGELVDVKRPQAWLDSLVDGQGANPVRFLQAADKDRVAMLLEALPIPKSAPQEALLAAGLKAAGLGFPMPPPSAHPLEAVDAIREGVFDRRTAVNRDAASKTKAAEETRRNAPAGAPDDVKVALEVARGTLSEVRQQIAEGKAMAEAALGEARRVKAVKVQAAKDQHELKAKETRGRLARELEAEVGRRRARLDREIANLRGANDDKVLQAEQDAAQAITRARDDAEAEYAAAEKAVGLLREEGASLEDTARLSAGQVASLEERAEGAAKGLALREQAQAFEVDAERLRARAEILTRALDALDAYRRRLAADVPVEGLEIEGKTLKVRGVPFDQVNTADRVRVAVAVACLRAKGQRLPLVFVDGAEALDRENFQALREALEAEGVQAFVARVTDGAALEVRK